jgi:large repetitive protein
MATNTLTVLPSNLTLEVGQTATLVAFVGGVRVAAFWASSNRPVATVGKTTGMVTAVAPGKGAVQATYHGMKAPCAFTVLAGKVLTLSVECPGNQTVAGSGSLTPVTWGPVQTSGGVAPIAIVSSPASGSGFPVGTTLVTVTATSADGQRASCQFSVTITGTSVPPPELLTITCPPALVVDSLDGNPVAVTIAATTT